LPVLKNLLRSMGIFLVSGVVAVLGSPSAAAHVDAYLDGAGPGETGLITLRVPTESGTAATTKVEVRIPDDVQLRTVLVQPVAGWEIQTTKREIDPPLYKSDGTPVTEVVSTVTWTTTGPGILPGQFDEFALEAGPLPDVDTLALPTLQTFSDGTTDAWTQPATEGEPEFPAPTVTLGASTDSASGGSGMGSVIAWTALGFAVIAVALGIFAIDRAARRSADADSSDAAPDPARSAVGE
jgi:uncharacterized protein YcnI